MTTANRTSNLADISARTLLTLAFAAAGLFKLAGADMMVQVFDNVGLGQWFRYLTGLIEVGAAILLWVPGLRGLAAAILLATMIGAVLAHALVLGMATSLPAVVLGLIAAWVTYSHRRDLPVGRPGAA